jgi:hypothetical protein
VRSVNTVKINIEDISKPMFKTVGLLADGKLLRQVAVIPLFSAASCRFSGIVKYHIKTN